MLCWTNEQIWNAELAKIPAVLRERFCDGVEELAINLGLQAVQCGTNCVEMNISGATPANVFKWLDEAHIAAVSIGPQDIVPLLGKNLDALLLKRAVENGTVRLEKLLPEEVMTSLREAAWSLNQTSAAEEDLSGVNVSIAQFELVRSGLMRQDEVDSFNDPFPGESKATFEQDHGILPPELVEIEPDRFDPFN